MLREGTCCRASNPTWRGNRARRHVQAKLAATATTERDVQVELLVLRIIHIVGGIIWVGSTVFSFLFLLPAVAQAGAAGGQIMVGLQKRKMFTVLPVVAILTMLSGIRLMQIVSNGFSASYFATPMGKAYAISGLLAILGFLVGVAIARPGAVRLGKLQQAAVSDEPSKEMIQKEIQALRSRVAMAGTATLTLLVLAAAGMAISRYM